MLTIQVDNAELEAQLIWRAEVSGKPTQQFVAELLTEALNQLVPAELAYPRLDPTQHSQPLHFDVDPLTDGSPAFQHVSDTVLFANQLRRSAWLR